MQRRDRSRRPATATEARQLTRRGLLAGAAGAAGVAGLGLPRIAVSAAARAPRTPRMDSLELGTLPAGVTRRVSAGRSFDLVGVQWWGDPRARVAIRTRTASGAWSPWADASDRGHAAGAAEEATGPGGRLGDPLWTGIGDQIEIRASSVLRGARLHLVDGGGTAEGAVAAGALPLAQPVLAAGPGQPPIIARAAWGQGLRPRGAPQYGAVHMAFVHHTESQNGYSSADVAAGLRSIFTFHRYVRGWKDIGYNFVIDRFGRIWEARAGGIDEPVAGAQAGGFNGVSTGVAILGSYSAQDISPAARRALVQLLAWKLSLHGLPANGKARVQVNPLDRSTSIFPAGAHVSLPRIAGHRDGDSTTCPGDALYHQLGGVRQAVHALAGRPARLTLLTRQDGVVAPGPIELGGMLALLDGTPLPGAPVLIQARQGPHAPARELTVAQATTDAAGSFTAQVPAAHNVSLRALHAGGPGAPAAVSDPLDALVAPMITLAAAHAQLPPGAPAELSGTVVPPKARVRLRMSAVSAAGGARHLRERVLDGSSASFQAAVSLPGPGRYRFEAATAPDGRSAAGASAVVDVVAG